MIKKFVSVLTKIQHVGFALIVGFALVSCSEKEVPTPQPQPQEPEFTEEELAEMAAADKFVAANSVYRALALLNELPDNWESATYTPAEGVAMDEANSDIRNVISTGADHAKSYFLSIVPDLGLNGDTWSHEGVGTLTFKVVNEANCYAVIDVDLVQMPGLKQLRFVPESVVGENSFSGEPYYRVGDVIQDKKKGTYWICVRPAGGPLKKDYAYFVSFDESLIKTTTQSQTIYNEENEKLTKEKNTGLSGKWTYAKNLVEERIAIAAGHTFAMFAGALWGKHAPYYAQFKKKAEQLMQDSVLDCTDLWREKLVDKPLDINHNSFAIAYGSYVKNGYTKVRQEKYLQPIMMVAHDGLDESGYLREVVSYVWYDAVTMDQMVTTPYLFSLTTDHDPLSIVLLTGLFGWNPNESYTDLFDIMNYTTGYAGKSTFEKPERVYMYNLHSYYVLVMTQMSLKDNGKGNNNYELISNPLENEQEPDFWESLELTHRYNYADGVCFELVDDIYE